jgi:NADH-quinone oxidoreductase subunit J
LDTILHPVLLYGSVALGGVGVWLALPRGKRTPQVLGALLAGAAGGMALLGLGLAGGLANLYFYVFALMGLGAALKVITHPRPVYAALYFILTVLAAAGLFLILSAEFMAFALIIVYAGAILITYLFVIMLATQAPEEGQEEAAQAPYDTNAREPFIACAASFLLLGVLTTMMFRGAGQLEKAAPLNPDALLVQMPRKVENVLRAHGMIEAGDKVAHDERTGRPAIDAEAGTITVNRKSGGTRVFTKDQWPADMHVKNIEGLGFDLLREHPGTIEIAGVILLMAMLGAVVLSRKQVQIDEDEKQKQALGDGGGR